MLRRYLIAIVLTLLSATPVAAQFTLQTFTPGTIIVAEDVNSNFALLANALDLRGGTMTGPLGGTSGTFSAALQAADLIATDDLTVGDAATIAGLLTTAAQAVSGDVTPGTTNTYDLGTSTSRWNNVFARLGNFSGAVTLGSTLDTNDVTVGGTLGVTGATTLLSTLDAQGAISNSTGSVTISDNLALGGLLTSTVAGTNSVIAQGNVTWTLQNAAGGTAGTTILNLSNDTSSNFQLVQFASGFTTSGVSFADGARLTATGTGGLTIGTSEASAVTRFFSGGSALRWTLEADGDLVPASPATYDLGASTARVDNVYTHRVQAGQQGGNGLLTAPFYAFADEPAMGLTLVNDDVYLGTDMENTSGNYMVFDSALETITLIANGASVSLDDGALNTSVSTHLRVWPLTTTPGAPAAGRSNVYVRNGNIVFQYDDSGTVRYKSLDLTGTGVTWVHSTTAP